MRYEVRFTQITDNGCYLAYTSEVESDIPLEEITAYNKKLRCFMTRELIEDEIKGKTGSSPRASKGE